MIDSYLHQMTDANTIEAAWDVHTAKMNEYGFDRLLYAYTRFGTGSSLGDLQDALILTNQDPAYVDEFIGQGMYSKGPMVAWASENTGSCSWNMIREQIAAGQVTPDMMEAMALNQRMNVVAGYTISFHEVSLRAKGAIGLCARDGMTQADVDDLWAESGSEIELANKILHLKVVQLPHTTGQRRQLTARQREVLEWVADGKTIQDTATIMGLNPATVEKHLRLARESLDVDTTAQAILKASSQNQFFLIER